MTDSLEPGFYRCHVRTEYRSEAGSRVVEYEEVLQVYPEEEPNKTHDIVVFINGVIDTTRSRWLYREDLRGMLRYRDRIEGRRVTDGAKPVRFEEDP